MHASFPQNNSDEDVDTGSVSDDEQEDKIPEDTELPIDTATNGTVESQYT